MYDGVRGSQHASCLQCDLYFEKYHGTTQNEAHIHGQQWVKIALNGE